MDDKSYNVYVKMIKLACQNVKTEICKLNMFKGPEVQVKLRAKDKLILLVEQIVKHSKNALTLYSSKVDQFLVIRCSEPTIHMLTASDIFVESITKSREARVAQKRLVELIATEKFLHDAYAFDSRHMIQPGTGSAIERAKSIVASIFSVNILGSFEFTAIGPKINDTVKYNLEETAYNTAFSFMTKDTVESLADKKYQAVFVPRLKLFEKHDTKPIVDPQTNTPINENVHTEVVAKVKTAMKNAKVHSKETPITSKTLMLTDLYRGTFANLPLSNRRRKFINLKVRNNDIMIAPRSTLISKRQFAKIEAMTKHNYIMDYYSDQRPDDLDDQNMAQYLFRQENRMYKYMWSVVQSVHYNNDRLYFPDGTNIVVPKEYAPHEFFHKVNTTYAALFGFSASQDAKGGTEWLYDAIRKAYTDEGTADYRLAMIEARLNKKI